MKEKMKLTRCRALRECARIWLWLAKNPDKEKSDYDLYSRSDLYSNGLTTCPACHFKNQIREDPNEICAPFCILSGTNAWSEHCRVEGSAFYEWEQAKEEATKVKYAYTIYLACINELEYLKTVPAVD